MKRKTLMMMAVPLVLAGGGAVWWALPTAQDDDAMGDAEVDGEREVAYWVAPMDAAYRRDEPGNSPMGMALEPVYADEVGEPGEIMVSGAIRQAMGIRVDAATEQSLPRVVHAPARVEYDEGRRSRVDLRVSGWIETLHVRTTGSAVRRGEPLFDLYSPQLVSVQKEFLQAVRGGDAGRIEDARERLLSLGVADSQIDALARDREVRQQVTFHARQAGVIERLEVAEGMQVVPGRPAMTIIDPSSMWVIADVFASQADWVRTGQPASVHLHGNPGARLDGEVDFVYPEFDTSTRTLPVRLRFDNADGRLRPGMYASVRIDTPGTDAVVTVPEQAVIRSGRQDRIAIAHGDGRFEIRPVDIGIAAAGRREIRGGVEAGERVVVAGQFLLDSEANIDAESDRLGEASADADGVEAEAQEYATTGTVEAIERDARKLTLDHAPVEALGWPRMVMDFAAAEGVDLDALATGVAIGFSFRERDDGRYEITTVEIDTDAGNADGGVGQ